MVDAHTRRTGIILVAVSAILWSTAGLFVRMATLDTWTIVGWRSVFSFLTLGVVVVVQKRGDVFRSLAAFGLPEVVTVVVTVVSTISYVVALRLTTVANVMTVYAALPFLATGLAFVWLGERVTARFLVAGTIALSGIVVMAGAVATSRDLLGIFAALVMTSGFATQLVHTKRHPRLDMTLLIAVAAAVCVPISIPVMQGAVPAPTQLLACAAYGVLTTGLAYILALKGGRLIPSGEAGLISMLDVVLGPFWVWLFYAERPTATVLVSGLVVLASVLWYLATAKPADLRRVSVAASALLGR